MKQNVVAVWATMLLFGAALYGCGNKEPPPTASTTASSIESLPPPPPTIAAQQEIALVERGARLADDGLYVTIDGSEFGGKKNVEFMPKSTDLIDPAAKLLEERDDLRLVITGYAGNAGRRAANEALSLQRATSVRDYLILHNHLDTNRAEVKGVGEAVPSAGKSSDEGGEKSERVVLRIVDGTGHYTSRVALGVAGSAPKAPSAE